MNVSNNTTKVKHGYAKLRRRGKKNGINHFKDLRPLKGFGKPETLKAVENPLSGWVKRQEAKPLQGSAAA